MSSIVEQSEWVDCINEAFEDAGIKATNEQKNTVASWVEGKHENWGMSHGHDAIPNPLEDVVRGLKRELEELRGSADEAAGLKEELGNKLDSIRAKNRVIEGLRDKLERERS